MNIASQLNLLRSRGSWSILLLVEIFVIIFLTPFFPVNWQSTIIRVAYSTLYFTAAYGLDGHRKLMLYVGGILFLIVWAAKWFHLPVLDIAAQVLNIIFFPTIVALLISQIARAKHVTPRVILDAINGYLLVGIVCAFMVGLMSLFDPTAYSFAHDNQLTPVDSIYYSFVTFATLGYGDITPLTPQSKSLSILIVICGQLYLAIIIALLLGKFSGKQ